MKIYYISLDRQAYIIVFFVFDQVPGCLNKYIKSRCWLKVKEYSYIPSASLNC